MLESLSRELFHQAGAKPAPRCACGHRRDEHDPNPTDYETRSGHVGRGRRCLVGHADHDPCPCTHYYPAPA